MSENKSIQKLTLAPVTENKSIKNLTLTPVTEEKEYIKLPPIAPIGAASLMSALFKNKNPTATNTANASAADPKAKDLKPNIMSLFSGSKLQENLKI